MARINITRLVILLQEEDQFLCNISRRLIVPCFSMVIIIRKRVNEEIIVCLYCLGGRPVSMQNFMLIVNIVRTIYQ